MTEIFEKEEVKKKTSVCRCKSLYQRKSHKLLNSISALENGNLLTFTESTEFNVAELFCSSNVGMYVWLDIVNSGLFSIQKIPDNFTLAA